VDDTNDIITAVHARFTDIQGPDIRDICYATQNRQSAVRDLSRLVDVIPVVGAANSSNSKISSSDCRKRSQQSDPRLLFGDQQEST
jgi:4-hydroxy-3-methylbut-2-enyl diphosphate reductase IspH